MINLKELPPYLSFENCGREVLEKVINTGEYSSYNIVTFYNYSKFYKKTSSRTAGPLGMDIKSPWMDKGKILQVYDKISHTWFDIHASTEKYGRHKEIDMHFYEEKFDLIQYIKRLIPNRIKSTIKSAYYN